MGVFWTLALNGGLALAAYTVSRFGLRQPPGLTRTLAAVVLGWAWLTVGSEVLGSLGWLTRGGLLGWVGAGLAVAGACLITNWGGTLAPRSAEPPPPWSWEEVFTGALVVWASAVYGALSLLRPVKVVSDGPIYHLYFAARWWQAGRLEAIAAPFGENAATYFPAVGDLWFAWLMVGWGGDRLAKVGQVPFAVVAGLAAVAMARRLGAGRPSAVVAAAWFLTSSPVFIFTFEPNVDTVFVAGYLLAAYFFLRHALGDDGPTALLLGALAAGSALGTKAPAVVFVPPLLLLGAASAVARGVAAASRVAGVLIVGLLPWTTAGFWYGRNALWTGNPLYPLHAAGFGRVWLRGWYGADVMRLSPYYLPVTDVRALVDVLLSVLDPRLAPVWLAAVAGLWAPGRRGGRGRDRMVWLASALAVANVGLYWLAVPYRTQQRFMIQALGLAAVPVAQLFDRGRVWRAAGVALLGVHVLTPQGWPFAADGPPPWDASPLIPDGISGLIRLPTVGEVRALVSGDTAPWPVVAVPALVGLLSFACVVAWSRVAAGRARVGRWVWAVATTAALVAAAVAPVYPWGQDDRQRFYPLFPDYYRGWLAFDRAAGPVGTRVAYAGTNLPYYLLGAGLRNEVRYINVDGHPSWLLHSYHFAAVGDGSGPAIWPYPRPGWDRAHPDYDAWLANLRAEGIRLLVVTRADPLNGPHNVADPEQFPVERVWAERHPEAFEPIYGDPLFRLYRLRPAAG